MNRTDGQVSRLSNAVVHRREVADADNLDNRRSPIGENRLASWALFAGRHPVATTLKDERREKLSEAANSASFSDRSSTRILKRMIPAAQLEKLQRLFAEDGVTITETEALEIGLWLISRVKPVLVPVPLDKMAQFATIRKELKAVRRTTPFANLFESRRKQCKKQKPSRTIDVSH